MVIGDDFIWIHFPKTAGTHVEKVMKKHFAQTPGVHFDPVDGEIIWHHNIDQRMNYDPNFDPNGKTIISGIRRLPHWLLSKTLFEFGRSSSILVPYRSMLMRGEFFEANGIINKADVYMHLYGDRVAKWVRVENIKDDFVSIFSNYLDLSRMDAEQEFSRKSNETRNNQIKDARFYFTNEDLEELYENNPHWAEIEQSVYGSLLQF